MSSIDIPILQGPLTPSSINNWLLHVEDSLEVWSAMNADKTLKPNLQIVLSGLKMEVSAVNWWNENRDALKKLSTWA